MESPTLTIVIPFYNNDKHLNQCLESVLQQTFQKWKCVAVDDGSEDGSFTVVDNYAKRDNRFQVIKRLDLCEKKGANVCRNIGLKMTDTAYCMFLDADDYLHHDCLKNRIAEITNNSTHEMYVFRTAFVDELGNISGYFSCPTHDTSELIYRLIAHKIPWQTMSPIWSSDFLKLIGGWNENFKRLQDVELNIRALLHKPTIFFSRRNTADSFYRSHPMSKKKNGRGSIGIYTISKSVL